MSTHKDKTIWTKMSGAENSFWIAYFPHIACDLEQTGPQIAKNLCQQEKADGLAILKPSNTCDFKWLFYNADGSSAEMCGNAACCVTDYVFKKKLISPKNSFFLLETKAGKIKGDLFKVSAPFFFKICGFFFLLSLFFQKSKFLEHSASFSAGFVIGFFPLSTLQET